ncbi:MAG TPA: EF-hand domain-containing protein [Magnetospirillum sp.]|nr:EF-hand domain-containing protein [Magnetospirillum sp.]
MARYVSPWVVAALILPAVAQAQLAPSQGGRAALAAFNRLDGNGDRALGRDELAMVSRRKAADALFSLMDADGDGRLSVKELGAASGALLARFDAYDVNKDGFVSRQEFPNFVDPRLLEALDRDGDGRLSLAELRPAFAGSVARAVPVHSPRKTINKPADSPQAWCWVTGFGSDRWTLEAPVTWGRCRTR